MASQTHTSDLATTPTALGIPFNIGRMEVLMSHLLALDEVMLETLEGISLAKTAQDAQRLAERGHAVRAMSAEFHGQIDSLVQSAFHTEGDGAR